MLQFFLLVTQLFYLTRVPLEAAEYGLADLEVLSQEGSYQEFFQHALDVRPTERQAPWKAMVVKMADGLSKQILSTGELKKDQFKLVERIYRWPVLKTDDVFRSRRQEIGLKYLRHCLKAERPCWDDLKAFWETDPTDPEIAFKLAEQLQAKEGSPIGTWSLLEVAVKSSLSEFYCQKDFVNNAIWSKLELDYVRLGPQGNLLKKIDMTVHPDCLRSFNIYVQERLRKPQDPGDRETAYQLLNAQGKVSPALTDFFYAVYLLEGPSKGELFNYAWNRVSELSRSSTRRDEVMRRIRELDPLPDDLFGSSDQIKRRAILNHFKSNFPEYLEFYAAQCLAYFGGKSAFPSGNPTMNCPALMKSQESISILGADKVNQFNQYRSL